MKILTLDFESYYDKDYSLSKLTTEEYIRGPLFEVIGVAVQVDNGEPEWFSGTRKEIRRFLEQFDFTNSLALAHNAVFDAAILTWCFGIKPKGWLDTLSMARAVHGTEVGGSLKALVEHYKLGEKGTEVVDALGIKRVAFGAEQLAKYGKYCENDVAITYALFQELSVGFPNVELRLIDLTVKMFSEPVLHLDTDALSAYKLTLEAQKAKLLVDLGTDEESLQSNAKFAEALSLLGVVPPVKMSLKTGKEAFAFAKNDEEFKELLEHENPLVQALVAARIGVKSTLEESRTQRFIDISMRGPMPVPLKYYAAHTGRWGGSDKINLQNLPSRGDNAGKLKKTILAPDGYMLIDCDSSQIEARTLAWLAGQDDLVEAFDKGQDVYKIMASAIYGKPVEEISKAERFVGKTTVLGCGYGMGAVKFHAALLTAGVTDITPAEAQRIIDVYRQTYSKIPLLWRAATEALKHISANFSTTLGRDGVLVIEGQKGIKLPNGLYVKYPNMQSVTNPDTGKYEVVYDTRKGKTIVNTRIYGGKCVENVCQALAKLIIGDQMLLIAKKYKVVMTVHDAVACIAPEDEVSEAVAYVEKCMRTRPSWALGLPLNCESGFGYSYGDC
jgi:DNA polymerase